MGEKQKKDIAPPAQEQGQAGGAWDKEHPFFQRAPQQAAGTEKGSEENVTAWTPLEALTSQIQDKNPGVKSEKLATGDELITSADGQVLKMPNGEKLTFARDPLTGDSTVELADKNGDLVELTYKFTRTSEPAWEVYQLANGAWLEARPDVGKLTYPKQSEDQIVQDQIIYDRAGICSITRGGKTVHLHDPQYDEIQPIVDPNRKINV